MQHLDEGTIHAWLDGQLPLNEAQVVESHLAECRPCADAVAEARGLIAASSRILTALDDVPRDVVPSRIQSPPATAPIERARTGAPAETRARRRWFTASSLAAAATIVVAVGTWTLMRSSQKTSYLAPRAESGASAAPARADSATAGANAARMRPSVAAPVEAPRPAHELSSAKVSAAPRTFAGEAPQKVAPQVAAEPAPEPSAGMPPTVGGRAPSVERARSADVATMDTATRIRVAGAANLQTVGRDERRLAKDDAPPAVRPSTTAVLDNRAAKAEPQPFAAAITTARGDSGGARERNRPAPEAPAPARAAAPPPAPTPAAQAADAQALSVFGCYDLGITPGSTQPGTGFREIPRRIALDSTVAAGPTDGIWYQVRTLDVRAGTLPDGVWRPSVPDGIEINWSAGSRTTQVRLTGVTSSVLRGTIAATDRATATGEAGSVVAAKRACDR